MDFLTDELEEEWFSVLESFQEQMGRFVLENKLEDKYGMLLMVTFEVLLENAVTEEKGVVAFADNFLHYCEKLLDAGVITPRASEEAFKESLKEVGRGDELDEV